MITQDTQVEFEIQELKGTGKVVGISSELPILGFMYIIQTESKISDIYQYNTFVCPEVYLKIKK